MLTALDMQFIEVAARAIYAATCEPGCVFCGWGGRADKTLKTHDAWLQGFGGDEHAYTPRSECPTTAIKLATASYHGRLIQTNGVRSIDEIVRGAMNATLNDPARSQRKCANDDCDLQHVTSRKWTPDGPGHAPKPFKFDTDAFFRAIATEAMGGEKWTSEHRVTLGDGRSHFTDCLIGDFPIEIASCMCAAAPKRPFTVPLITEEVPNAAS